jgi:hypothetical protein
MLEVVVVGQQLRAQCVALADLAVAAMAEQTV